MNHLRSTRDTDRGSLLCLHVFELTPGAAPSLAKPAALRRAGHTGVNHRASSGTSPAAAPEDGALVLNFVQSSGANSSWRKAAWQGTWKSQVSCTKCDGSIPAVLLYSCSKKQKSPMEDEQLILNSILSQMCSS